jgi:septal ring factor EnvC (AmiA/AmiB activator)
MSKRLSPERIAEIRRLAVHSDSVLPCELIGHIDAIEADLAEQRDGATKRIDEQNAELEEADALSDRLEKELAEAKAMADKWRALCEKATAIAEAAESRIKTLTDALFAATGGHVDLDKLGGR